MWQHVFEVAFGTFIGIIAAFICIRPAIQNKLESYRTLDGKRST